MTPSLESVLADPALDGERLMAGWLESIPLGRLPEPRDMAAAVLFLVSDQARMITGALLPVDGGNLALNAGGSVRW
jgi:NAD(P)-dependent dehydrogenase (short-subunit alcohol dehydrogenase family)